MQAQSKQVGDLTVNYFAAGSGHPVLLLHGSGSRAMCFEDVMPLLAKHFHVFAFDQRGSGSTQRPAKPEASFDAWRDDAFRFMDAMGLKQATVVGWSLGAATALQMALAKPDRVSHVVMLGAGAGPGGQPGDRTGFEVRKKLIEAGATQAEIVEKTFEFTKKSLSANTVKNKPHVIEKVRREHLAINPQGYHEILKAMANRPAINERLGEITCPTLIVCGEEDTRTPLSNSIGFNRVMANSWLKVLGDCGHHYGYEQPEEVSRYIIDFVKAFDPARLAAAGRAA